MTAEPLTCPYCNAYVTGPAVAGQRVLCPRCGESFSVRPAGVMVSVPAGSRHVTTAPADVAPSRPEPEVPPTDSFRMKAGLLLRVLLLIAVLLALGVTVLWRTGILPDLVSAGAGLAICLAVFAAGAFLWVWFFRVRRSNRAAALFVLANMGVLAVGMLAAAVATQQVRRAHDTALGRPPRHTPAPAESDEGPVAAVAPDRLAALGYLPPWAGIVVGVRVAELTGGQEGSLLDAPIKVGGLSFRLNNLTRWTGLEPGELDHVVLGLQPDDALPPRFSLAARTRRPYDADKVRDALHARHVSGAGNKALYRFEVEDLGLPLVLWCPDDHTVVVGQLDKHRDLVQDPPHQGLAQLPDEVRTALRERLGAAGPVWAVGHVRDWADTPFLLLFRRLKKEDLDRVKKVRTFAAQLEPGPTAKLTAAFRCDDPAAARSLEQLVRGTGQDGRPGLKTAVAGDWLTVQLETDRAAVRGALQR